MSRAREDVAPGAGGEKSVCGGVEREIRVPAELRAKGDSHPGSAIGAGRRAALFAQGQPVGDAFQGERRLYFVVSQPRTRIAALLGLFTRARRNHVSLLLRPGAEEMYSFGRRLRFFPLVGGFVVERLGAGVLRRCAARSPFDLVELSLSEEQWRGVERRLRPFLREPERFSYNLLGLLPQLFGVQWERRRHFSCSQFCAFLVAEAVELPKGYSVMLPEDFYKLGRVVRSGWLSELLVREFAI